MVFHQSVEDGLRAGVKEEEEQRQCLELGREAGLDIGMVTKTVVETIRTTGQLVSLPPAGPLAASTLLLLTGGHRPAVD